MARFGQVLVIIGVIATFITFVSAFGLMFYGGYDEWAKLLFMLVPFSFLILFTGVATVALFAPHNPEKEREHKL